MIAAISWTASSNSASLAFAGRTVPLTLRTNWSEAAYTSSSVAGGSRFCSGRMLRHMPDRVCRSLRSGHGPLAIRATILRMASRVPGIRRTVLTVSSAGLLGISGLAGVAGCTADKAAPGPTTTSTTTLPGPVTTGATTYTASGAAKTAVSATTGTLELTDATVTSSSVATVPLDALASGTNAAILASGGRIVTTGGTVTTSGAGGVGLFAGAGGGVDLTGTKITTSGANAPALRATKGGSLRANEVVATTKGAMSPTISVAPDAGPVAIADGSFATAGTQAPALASAATVAVSGTGLFAQAAPAVMVYAGSLTLSDVTMQSGRIGGIVLSGELGRSGSAPRVALSGGSLTVADGPLFAVVGTEADVAVSGAALEPDSGLLLEVSAGTGGAAGSAPGVARLVATGQTLTGDVVVAAGSTASVTMRGESTWQGAFDTANTAGSGQGAAATALVLDSSSTWTVGADSYIGKVSGLTMTGSTVGNIIGNGHTVYYDVASSPELNGQTYTLTGKGTLRPR